MELYQLRAFLAVARSGQLTRAGEQLHLTQSAVSKQIKCLEDELGVLLFERTPVGMTLSRAGGRLLPLASRAIETTMAMESLSASMRGTVSGDLHLGTIIDPESIRLGPLLGAMLQFYPHVGVKLCHGISGGVLAMLTDTDLDACFYLGALSDPEIVSLPLSLEHYVVVGPVVWRDQLTSAGWEDLAAMPWLATPKGSSQHALVAQMFAERGLTHRTVVEADQEASMIEIVEAGVALGLMRERLATPAAFANRAFVWPGARIPCQLSLLYRRSAQDAAVVQALLATVRMVWPPLNDDDPPTA